jgi:hypothetical protein
MVPDISHFIFRRKVVLGADGTRFHNAHYWGGRMELDGACAMSSATDFETYAQDCVKLAEQPDAPPELREQLLQMAREWMQATMEAEDGSS